VLYRWFPSVLKAITIIRPETLVRWHRARFRAVLALEIWLVWRPPEDRCGELRALIRRISAENPLWGAPRIHGELLKLGFEVAQSSVATLARHAARIGLSREWSIIQPPRPAARTRLPGT
jgi:hypothetical protein